MKLNDLLGASFDCTCGSHHTVPTKYFIYNNNAFTSLLPLVREKSDTKSCLVIADSRTFEVAGRAVVNHLESDDLKTTHFIVPDLQEGSPVADDQTRDVLLEQTPEVDLYIAVGSGVINDLVKWLAFLRKKPYIVVATAASMNGYGSANVAATIDGLKVLFHAQAPRAVLATPDIIKDAPYDLSTSGLGDVLAKSVSSADWKLNQFLFQDYYCRFCVDLLKDLEPIYLQNPQKIKGRDPQGFEALFTALFYSSVAMTVSGTSSPASGGEHLISHAIDILAGRDGVSHDLHGRQVGVASILMAALYERVMSVDTPELRDLHKHVDQKFWGSLTPIVENEYQKKLPKLKKAATILSQKERWDELKTTIAPQLTSAVKLKKCLQQADGAHTYSHININNMPLTKESFISVVNHAAQMRNRFTILDLATLLGIIPRETETLVEEWVS